MSASALSAALARIGKAELVAGDPEFEPLEQEIKIHLLKLKSLSTEGALTEFQGYQAPSGN
jgi:hypothetical protein